MPKLSETLFVNGRVLSGPESLGSAIRSRRTEAGITLEHAALGLGIAKQTLQNLERGGPGVALGTALRVAQEFGVSLFVVPAEQEVRLLRAIDALDRSV